MSAIYNHLKNTVDNHINGYSKKGLFIIKTLTYSAKPYSVKYAITYQNINFSIDVEYVNRQIEFNFSIDSFNSIEALNRIHDFVKHIELMPQENLKTILAFSLRN